MIRCYIETFRRSHISMLADLSGKTINSMILLLVRALRNLKLQRFEWIIAKQRTLYLGNGDFLLVQLWRRRSTRCLEPFLLKAYDFCSTSPQESGVDISSCFAVHLLVIFCALTNISYSFSHAKRALKWSAKHELKSNPDARRRVLQKSYSSFRKRSKTRGEWRGLSCTRKNSPFPRCNVTTH